MSFEHENNQDWGGKPCLINIRQKTICNNNFRTAIWSGKYLQVTVMTIPVGGEIGLEMHDNLDQFIKVENGLADVYMGNSKQNVKFVSKINANYAVLIPYGTWHNIINVCSSPLKVYSIYAPLQHPFATIHKTKLESDLSEE